MGSDVPIRWLFDKFLVSAESFLFQFMRSQVYLIAAPPIEGWFVSAADRSMTLGGPTQSEQSWHVVACLSQCVCCTLAPYVQLRRSGGPRAQKRRRRIPVL